MMGRVTKYSPVTAYLASLPEDQRAVEMTMIEIGRLCGGLPPSASSRTWWANNSQVQARAWRTAGWHVERVDLNGGRVRFERGRVGARDPRVRRQLLHHDGRWRRTRWSGGA